MWIGVDGFSDDLALTDAGHDTFGEADDAERTSWLLHSSLPEDEQASVIWYGIADQPHCAVMTTEANPSAEYQ